MDRADVYRNDCDIQGTSKKRKKQQEKHNAVSYPQLCGRLYKPYKVSLLDCFFIGTFFNSCISRTMSKNLARQTNAVILLASIYSGNPQYRFDLILNSSRPITGSEKTKSAKKMLIAFFKLGLELCKHFVAIQRIYFTYVVRGLQKLLTD